mmetsp:Transcript_36609/g.66372  ORF Transcript_36609/g.66372 Transcript_36609/m.66372 type:complete len:407 (-) Transcript_36609:86-1306(-)|eukprot:CAMPEP_0197642884 /NCGR_PEP_ID=MMETSP1338-20131121/16403_1 /TAXON_ID=43686 ORGANISM="Pelagodinium beii, Strain RCC1491" /NCGR_SAMPLE_ID=MMETSP1338 /ASSEMBLY_ACC=CAM_ASM_000754 /LENGTH=406 /DNA_ID=CAMNT_0043216071 /DNA_START=110 /DNA_END=1330 /DNA_ORIENTATION=-
MMQPQKQWTELGISGKLCLLAIDDKKGNPRLGSLPPSLYSQMIAPFLRFDGPVGDQLYVLGGRDHKQDPLDVVEHFDSWNGRWITCPPMTVKRAGCAAASLPDGRLLVAGGYDERGIVRGVLGSCEVFNPAKQTWDPQCHNLLKARWGHGCAVLGGHVYAVGGCALLPGSVTGEELMETLRTCEVYDPSANIWCAAGSLNVARAGARLVSISSSKLAAVGGCDDVFGRAEMLASVEILIEGTGTWTLLDAPLGVPRTTAAAVALDETRILVMGGAPSLSSAEVYNMPQRSQSSTSCRPSTPLVGSHPISDMAEGRMGCQAVTMKLPAPGRSFPTCTRQCVVVVGGENGDEDWDDEGMALARQFSTVLVYDQEDGKWRHTDAFPPLPTPRTAMALCVAPGLVAGHSW